MDRFRLQMLLYYSLDQSVSAKWKTGEGGLLVVGVVIVLHIVPQINSILKLLLLTTKVAMVRLFSVRQKLGTCQQGRETRR